MSKHSSLSPAKWTASVSGFLSSSALLAPDASAALVQVDFIDNQITAGGGNQLFTDIDFDGDSDFTISNADFTSFSGGLSATYSGRVNIEGNLNRGRFFSSNFTVTVINNSNTVDGVGSTSNGFVSVELTGSSALGDNRQGFLEIRTVSNDFENNGVYIERFVFDDASASLDINNPLLDLDTDYTSVGTTTVSMTTINPASPIPEASSIAMLAAGAGGLMMRRRRQQAV